MKPALLDKLDVVSFSMALTVSHIYAPKVETKGKHAQSGWLATQRLAGENRDTDEVHILAKAKAAIAAVLTLGTF